MSFRDSWSRWKRFNESPAHMLRPVILRSWRRCRSAGLRPDPPTLQLTKTSDQDLESRLRDNAVLLQIAAPHIAWVHRWLQAIPHVVYIVDRGGIVLHALGTDSSVMEKAGLLPGYDWSESRMGTNGAGTAIAADQPVAVIGSEHYVHAWHGFTCLGAPIHDPTGAVIGAIDISTAAADGEPDRLIIAAYVAYTIEKELAARQLADMRAEAQSTIRLKNDLFAMVSHELGNTLSGILIWSRMLRNVSLPVRDKGRAVEIIYEGATNLSRLLEDLMDLSRISVGKLRMQFEPIDLADIVTLVAQSIGIMAEAIVQLHGGKIHAASCGMETGATFRVTIPLASVQ